MFIVNLWIGGAGERAIGRDKEAETKMKNEMS